MPRFTLAISAASFAALTVCLTALLALPASAHHGWSSYNQEAQLELTVTKLDFGNPHDRLEGEDADGKTWSLLLAPPVRNRRYGFGEDTVALGQSVLVLGETHPTRAEAKVHQIWLEDVMIYEYLYGENYSSYDRLGKTAPTPETKR